MDVDSAEREPTELTGRWFEQVAKHTPDGITICEYDPIKRTRRLVMCNDRFVEMSGRTREELLAVENINDLVREVEDVPGQPTIEGVYTHGVDRWLRPDGEENYHEFTSVPIRVGEKLYLVGVDRDVTDQFKTGQTLRDSTESEGAFRRRLEALNEVTTSLAAAETVEDLCRMGVEMGRNRLGFERLGIWFTDKDDPNTLNGSFGTDQDGRTRDERGRRITYSPDYVVAQVMNGRALLGVVGDYRVGYDDGDSPQSTQQVISPLWDGQAVIGIIAADSLLTGQRATKQQCQLLGLFASSLGHLYMRKLAENELRDNEEAARTFSDRLQELHEVCLALAAAETTDDLCHQAVELGHSRLGFDRLGIWLADGETPGLFNGTFGIDENGQIRDERSCHFTIGDDGPLAQVVSGQHGLVEDDDCPLRDCRGQVVGRGKFIKAALHDGERVMGMIAVDNLLRGEPITKRQTDMIRLFASSVGFLCTRKRAEQALRKSEADYRLLVENQSDMVIEFDSDRRLLFVSPSYCRMFDKADSDLLGKEFAPSVHPDDKDATAKFLDKLLAAPSRGYVEHRSMTETGWRWVAWSGDSVAGPDGQVAAVVAVGRDVTEHKRLEELAVEAVTMERRRIGQDLHDSLGQMLTGMAFMSKGLEASLSRKSLPEAANAERIADHMDKAISMTRSLARGLYPAKIVASGLADTLVEMAADTANVFGISCIAECQPDVAIANDEAAVNVYHIVQEAVSNSIKHGEATEITIGLGADTDGRTVLTVTDNGVGVHKPIDEGRGMGMRSMRMRAVMLDGQFDIALGPNGGTVVTCRFRGSPGAQQ